MGGASCPGRIGWTPFSARVAERPLVRKLSVARVDECGRYDVERMSGREERVRLLTNALR